MSCTAINGWDSWKDYRKSNKLTAIFGIPYGNVYTVKTLEGAERISDLLYLFNWFTFNYSSSLWFIFCYFNGKSYGKVPNSIHHNLIWIRQYVMSLKGIRIMDIWIESWIIFPQFLYEFLNVCTLVSWTKFISVYIWIYIPQL